MVLHAASHSCRACSSFEADVEEEFADEEDEVLDEEARPAPTCLVT